MRSRNFIYANSSIRVAGIKDPHKNWYPNAAALWNQHINWQEIKSYFDKNCHGTDAGAKIIEDTINRLSKYTGLLAEDKISPEDLGAGINKDTAADLVNNLHNLNLGSTTAISLLDYFFTGKGRSTAINAGFSFEKRLDEFIRILAEDSSSSLRTGAKQVYAGESILFYLGDFPEQTSTKKGKNSLVKTILEDIGKDYSEFVQFSYKEVQRNINGTIQPDIAVVAYKVPQKADLTVHNYMNIKTKYGPLIDNFLHIISNARLSVKNTTQTDITLGSTNDNTRLRAFISEFANNIEKNFATICTFIFSSKRSNIPIVSKYLSWARISYELLGVGQRSNLTGTSDGLLVDYLIINKYGSSGNDYTPGQVSVFNVKNLLKNLPTGDYKPPFIIENKGKEKEAGSVKISFS